MNDFQQILKLLLEVTPDPAAAAASGAVDETASSIEDAKNPFQALMAFKKEHETLIGGLRTEVAEVLAGLQGALTTATGQRQFVRDQGIESGNKLAAASAARQAERDKVQTTAQSGATRDALRARVAALRGQNVNPTNPTNPAGGA
jgi:hypothetical protein